MSLWQRNGGMVRVEVELVFPAEKHKPDFASQDNFWVTRFDRQQKERWEVVRRSRASKYFDYEQSCSVLVLSMWECFEFPVAKKNANTIWCRACVREWVGGSPVSRKAKRQISRDNRHRRWIFWGTIQSLNENSLDGEKLQFNEAMACFVESPITSW